MTIANLQEQGFHATGTDAMNLATRTLTDCRILIKPGELERAAAALEELFERSLDDVTQPPTLWLLNTSVCFAW
jgi:hypothetical protein